MQNYATPLYHAARRISAEWGSAAARHNGVKPEQRGILLPPHIPICRCNMCVAHRTKFGKKVHKPPLRNKKVFVL